MSAEEAVTDEALQREIVALVNDAMGAELGGAAAPLTVRISGEHGGELHDPEEVMRQVSELVLGGLEITTAEGDRRRISFDGGQLSRALGDSHLLEFMKIEISYVILAALGKFIFARSEISQATIDVRETIEALLISIETQISAQSARLGGRTQQKLISVLREALSEENEKRLIRIEQDDRRNKKKLIKDLTRRIIDSFGGGMEVFTRDRERYQQMAESGFDRATSLPMFNRILETNLSTLFDLIWALRFKDAIEQCLGEYESNRTLSGLDVMRALDFTQSEVIPAARRAFVGMLMGTHKPLARFAKGAHLVASVTAPSP